MKTVNAVMESIKGVGNSNDILTGKNPFSQTTFNDVVSAAINDTTFKVPQYDAKTGEKIGELNISELIRNDVKKTLDNAKYPQKPEAGVIDTVDIATKGIAKAIPEIIMLYLSTGKQLPIPPQPDMVGSIYLTEVKGSTKDIKCRNPQTQEDLGTVRVVTQDHKQIRVASPTPQHLQKKEKIG